MRDEGIYYLLRKDGCEGICGLRVIGSRCMIQDLLLDIFCHGLVYVRGIHSWVPMKFFFEPLDNM